MMRLQWALGVLLVIAAITICLLPGDDIPALLSDKAYHMLGHACLAAYFSGIVPRRSWWKIFAFLLVMGVAIEFAQHYMQLGRRGDVLDVAANSLGAAFGILLGHLGLARWPQWVPHLRGQKSP
jgi:VanZ family protein